MPMEHANIVVRFIMPKEHCNHKQANKQTLGLETYIWDLGLVFRVLKYILGFWTCVQGLGLIFRSFGIYI